MECLAQQWLGDFGDLTELGDSSSHMNCRAEGEVKEKVTSLLSKLQQYLPQILHSNASGQEEAKDKSSGVHTYCK